MSMKIIYKPKIVGNYDRVVCPHCEKDFQHGTRTEMPMPYCGNCGKIVLDASQKFCGWCGCKFDGQEG
jgi:hypothetical protein